MSYETHDEEFAIFMRKVDAVFIKNIGISYEEMPDWNYYDCFDEGMTPQEVFDDWKTEYWPG